MSTKAKFLENTYCFNDKARIIKIFKSERLYHITLDKTIFYPQGGGQPSDTGYITINDKNHYVSFVEYVASNIIHNITTDFDDTIILNNTEVGLTVNKQRRLENAKSHTAGHLITHILEEMNPDLIPAKGHHFPSECYVEMKDSLRKAKTDILPEVNNRIKKNIESGYKVYASLTDFEEIEKKRPFLAKYIPKGKPTRTVTIGNYTSVPCGGTHVKNTSELVGLNITRIKKKKDMLKISYGFN